MNTTIKSLSIVSLVLLVFCITNNLRAAQDLSQKVGTLASYKKTIFSNDTVNYLKNNDFENGLRNWSFKGNTTVDNIQGHTEPKALLHKRDNAKEYHVIRQYFKKLPPGKYIFGGWLKTERIDDKKSSEAQIGLEFYRKNKYIGGKYSNPIESTTWTKFTKKISIPEFVDLVIFSIYLKKGDIGKVWFDDMFLTPDKPEFDAYTITPRGESTNPGIIDFTIGLVYQKEASIAKDLVLQLIVSKDNKVVSELFFEVVGSRSSGSINMETPGEYNITVRMLDTKNKTIIGEDKLCWTCRDADIKVPDNACLIDDKCRVVVNKQVYMPIGLFTGTLTKSSIDKISTSAFNTIMSYSSMTLSFGKFNQETQIQDVISVMDYCKDKKLKVIFSIKDVYSGSKRSQISFAEAQGEIPTIKKVVGSLKDHPALLAWYIGDEMPARMRNRGYQRRVLIRELDPFHPTWAVHVDTASLPILGKISDIIGVDRYPIVSRSYPAHLGGIDGSMEMAKFAYSDTSGNLPIWGVPQAFNFGNYEPNISQDEFKERFRNPTEMEIRSMALLYAGMGAKGFIFYSFHDLWRKYSKDSGNEQWTKLCNVASLLKELEPYIMSGKPIKNVAIKCNSPNTVKAFQLENEQNKKILIIIAMTPTYNEASIQINHLQDYKDYKSRFGLSSKQADGSFTFKSKGIGSDIIEQ
ncbi:MAG: carbohydrate binding domain-containing protein [Victivallales bacterium]|nr:carbohydrate binding domain-containing protein [Victivallales bacterium]